MSKITPTQRILNIITEAVELGLEINQKETLENIALESEDFLVENKEAENIICNLVSLGSHGQRCDYSDGHGYDYWQQGEIISAATLLKAAPGELIHYATIIDSKAYVLHLCHQIEA